MGQTYDHEVANWFGKSAYRACLPSFVALYVYAHVRRGYIDRDRSPSVLPAAASVVGPTHIGAAATGTRSALVHERRGDQGARRTAADSCEADVASAARARERDLAAARQAALPRPELRHVPAPAAVSVRVRMRECVLRARVSACLRVCIYGFVCTQACACTRPRRARRNFHVISA